MCRPPPTDPTPPPRHRDEGAAVSYVKGVISDLLQNKVDMSLLVVTKVGWGWGCRGVALGPTLGTQCMRWLGLDGWLRCAALVVVIQGGL